MSDQSSSHSDKDVAAQKTQPTTDADASLGTQLKLFIGVGIISAIVDMGLTFALDYLFLGRAAAKAIGWCAGTTTAYLLNAKWTFKAKTSTKSTLAVAALYLSTFAVQNILYSVLEQPFYSLGMSKFWVDICSFIVAQGTATIVNFAVQRTFIFNNKKKS